jgi:FMN phosphatase YigB (HAD superfamily)
VISTLLIDLDDTLLENNMARFIPAYLKLLGDHLSHIAPPDQVLTQVMAGTQAMLEDLDPTRCLRQVFAERFYPALGVSEEDLQSEIEDFYANVFPSLQPVTNRNPTAQKLVSRALDAGIEVVIATSPLFPRTAIEQRLAWAGVPTEQYAYSLVTSYEDFHFAKPRMDYYTEILGYLGTPASRAAMIGNDETDDIIPAKALGMAVFYVNHSPDTHPGGSLADAIAWLEEIKDRPEPEIVHSPDALVARLRGQLAALLGLTKDLDESDWSRRPEPGEWAPNEIVCHLRDVDLEVNLPRIRALLTQHEPHLSAFDTDRWAEERDYLHQSGPDALASHVDARLNCIHELESIGPEIWSRSARHTLFGMTSLAEVVRIGVEHELMHLGQLRST